MLPLSLGRAGAPDARRREFQPPLAWFRPANIASATSAELRVLIIWLACFVLIGVGIGLGHVWLRLKVTDIGYRLSATRQVVERLEREANELTMEVARLDAPGRLEEAAGVRLGMVQPEKNQEAVLP
jgi:cell division protein FtsL